MVKYPCPPRIRLRETIENFASSGGTEINLAN
jgi:hypothetical protein